MSQGPQTSVHLCGWRAELPLEGWRQGHSTPDRGHAVNSRLQHSLSSPLPHPPAAGTLPVTLHPPHLPGPLFRCALASCPAHWWGVRQPAPSIWAARGSRVWKGSLSPDLTPTSRGGMAMPESMAAAQVTAPAAHTWAWGTTLRGLQAIPCPETKPESRAAGSRDCPCHRSCLPAYRFKSP